MLLTPQERRKRRGGPLRLVGLVLPAKALAPLVPLYLQVRGRGRVGDGMGKTAAPLTHRVPCVQCTLQRPHLAMHRFALLLASP